MREMTPLRLAKLVMTGCALVLLAYGLSWLTDTKVADDARFWPLLWQRRVELATLSLPLLTGCTMGWWGASRLAKGAKSGIWSEEQLAQARAWVNAPWLQWTQRAAILGFLALWIYNLIHRGHSGSVALLALAINPLSAITRALAKPRVTGPRLNWHDVQPIHSDHWGQPSSFS